MCVCVCVFGHMAYRILVPWPGIELMPPAMEEQILNHWTTREVRLSRLLLTTPSEAQGNSVVRRAGLSPAYDCISRQRWFSKGSCWVRCIPCGHISGRERTGQVTEKDPGPSHGCHPQGHRELSCVSLSPWQTMGLELIVWLVRKQ